MQQRATTSLLRERSARLKPENIVLEKPGRGAHWKLGGPGGTTYPVPAHNGERTEIARESIRGWCRCFDVPRDFFDR